jgi:hypothetical protein
MLVTLSILLLFIAPTCMYLIRKVRPGFTFPWLIGVLGASLSWFLILASAETSPKTQTIIDWQLSSLFSNSPTLLFDEISWAFSISVTALGLAVLLTGIVGIQISDISSWSSTLLLVGVSLSAIHAGNMLTMIMAWAALDLTLLVILLFSTNQSKARERIIFAFSIKAVGILLLLWASITAYTPGAQMSFESAAQSSYLLILTAAVLRLAALPLLLAGEEDININRGMRMLVIFIPAAASLVLLARTAPADIPLNAAPYLLGAASFLALLFSTIWAIRIEKNKGQALWVLGMASLAASAAIMGHQSATISWSIGLLLSGGLLYLFFSYHKNLLPVMIFSVYMISALPFSQTWIGMEIYSPPLIIFHLPLFLAQTLLVIGFMRRFFTLSSPSSELERWSWVLYPLGLAILIISQLVFHIRTLPEISGINLTGWFGGIAAVGLAAVSLKFQYRLPAFPESVRKAINNTWSMRWASNFLWNTYRTLGEVLSRLNRILEGEGGVLWAFVLLAIIISLVSQRVFGG